jgi:hypothetical protein
MDYERMFPLLDFLEERRTNKTTGNALGFWSPVVFTLTELQAFSDIANKIFKNDDDLVEMLRILDSATIGLEHSSKKVCSLPHATSTVGGALELQYTVHIITKSICEFRTWLKKCTGKSQMELKSSGKLFYNGHETSGKLSTNCVTFVVLRYILSRGVHVGIPIVDIQHNLQRSFKDDIITRDKLYRTMEHLRKIIKKATRGKIPWKRISKGMVTLDF